MSMPQIPTIVAGTINPNRTEVINLLLASIAMEELSLAHIVNAEAEKIQAVLGTLSGGPESVQATTFGDLITTEQSVGNILKDVIKKEMLLQFKLEDIISILPPPPPSKCNCGLIARVSNEDIDLNINICPSCFLTGSSFSISLPGSNVSFIATEINEPACFLENDLLLTVGKGSLNGESPSSFILFAGPTGLVLMISPLPITFKIDISLPPIMNCGTSDTQSFRKIKNQASANDKITWIMMKDGKEVKRINLDELMKTQATTSDKITMMQDGKVVKQINLDELMKTQATTSDKITWIMMKDDKEVKRFNLDEL